MKGRIQIDGRVRISADRIEAHLTGNSLRGALNGNWARLTLNKSTGEFHASLATIPGGFYELDVRALKAGSPVAEITVPHVGVGEVFIVSGQSNATNYGEVRQVTETHTMVQLALAWVLRRPEVSSAIIGASRPEQVEANVRAVGVKLPGAVLQRIDEAIAKVVVR